MYPDVLCVGEAIVDFHARERRALGEASTFLKTVGGAPTNLAIGLARLGERVGFVGALGNDPFGRFLQRQLEREHVDVNGIVVKRGRRTRLAFIAHDERGEPEFAFWESLPADADLTKLDIPLTTLARANIVHISSFLLLSARQASFALWLARRAAETSTLVSFDPNLRLALWSDRRKARAVLRSMVRHTSIFRGNTTEGAFVTGRRTPEASIEALLQMGPQLVVLTDGARGCYFGTERIRGFVAAFRVRTVDGTGCGDGFTAALLSGVLRLKCPLSGLTERQLTSLCRYANAVGALVATRAGAAASMPTRAAVDSFLAGRPKSSISSGRGRSERTGKGGA
jgi:fructokinase